MLCCHPSCRQCKQTFLYEFLFGICSLVIVFLQVVYDARNLLHINRDSIPDDIVCVFSRQVSTIEVGCLFSGFVVCE